MRNAVDSVLQGRMDYYLAAKTFGVPQTTLEREVKKVRESSKENASPTMETKCKWPIYATHNGVFWKENGSTADANAVPGAWEICSDSG
ncbi:hypothetical protein HHI36_009704 [Cryptolaemus montrouzieri]|uniref:HTH psq-type domain-containing protein n=1 Tax=Cryptolaemus montrouzieri TaxID=559131 RepID=A0ABD2MGM4_9CUCU